MRDFNFGSSGIAYSGLPITSAADIAIQPDGSIVAAGFSSETTVSGGAGAAGNVPMLARLTAGDIAGGKIKVPSTRVPRKVDANQLDNPTWPKTNHQARTELCT